MSLTDEKIRYLIRLGWRKSVNGYMVDPYGKHQISMVALKRMSLEEVKRKGQM